MNSSVDFNNDPFGANLQAWDREAIDAVYGAAQAPPPCTPPSITVQPQSSALGNAPVTLSVGASGDLAYIVGIEHTTANVGGAGPKSYSLRVTTIFRREDGEWKVVHRHGDPYDSTTETVIAELS
jgi:hypothetical protein